MPQPVADARYSAFVRVGARVWTVEDAPVTEQPYADAGALPLADFGAQLDEQRLDVPPRDIGRGRMLKEQRDSASVAALQMA